MTAVPRAFRGVGLIVAFWAGGRALVLTWPEGVAREAPPGSPPLPRVVPEAGEFAGIETAYAAPRAAEAPAPLDMDVRPPAAIPGGNPVRGAPESEQPESFTALPPPPIYLSTSKTAGLVSPPNSPEIAQQGERRASWSMSGWALVRGGGVAGGLAPNGQLGGSQIGARATLRVAELAPGLRIGPTARISSALNGPAQREVAAGVSVRLQGAIPVEVVAERRFGLSGGTKDRFALLAATGISDMALPADLRASGYVQAGVAGLKQRDGFVDGAARVERPVHQYAIGEVRVGANVWGAAQPGASRLDAGPSVALKTDLLGQPMRISVEYRQRLAGDAAPKSGPAITIGADF